MGWDKSSPDSHETDGWAMRRKPVPLSWLALEDRLSALQWWLNEDTPTLCYMTHRDPDHDLYTQATRHTPLSSQLAVENHSPQRRLQRPPLLIWLTCRWWVRATPLWNGSTASHCVRQQQEITGGTETTQFHVWPALCSCAWLSHFCFGR